MKNIIITIVLLLVGINSGLGQYVLKNADDVNWYANIPQEQIHVDHNASLYFTGESLYFKVYCSNAKTKVLSSNSKIAYVELIGESGLVFRQKIRLKDGLGQGDFFIPVSVRTGNYKIIGYTRWMLNGTGNNFFQANVSIINPYAKILFEKNLDMGPSSSVAENVTDSRIDLFINKRNYKKRELVNLIIESQDVNTLGTYSISVRKKDEVLHGLGMLQEFTSPNPTMASGRNKTKTIGETIYLPEFKGEMITGVVKDKSMGSEVANTEVGLSILSPEAIQDITKTNGKGNFYFQIPDDYRIPKALIQVIGEDRLNYTLEMDDHASIDYSVLQFNELKIDEDLREAIIERSVNNQIENAYLSVKEDKVIPPEYPKPFYGNPMTTYRLDDYKRFKDVAETLDEVVDHAYHERRGGKTRYINVRERESDPYYDVDILPMVVVDGASIQDHQSLLYFETKDVESMSVLRQEYYYGDKVYQGVLMINTYNKDYYKNLKGDHSKIVDLERPQMLTKYFNQEYSPAIDSNRIPDQRMQLLWIPDLELKEKRQQTQFFTSDIPGTYLIEFKGFTDVGEWISIERNFIVD